jgi:hypothetical protein
MSTEENKVTVRRFYEEVINQKHLSLRRDRSVSDLGKLLHFVGEELDTIGALGQTCR